MNNQRENIMGNLLGSIDMPGNHRFEIVSGDITMQKVDAIVNAANKHLKHGGGLAGIIVRNGGSVIQTESDAWIKDHGPITHKIPAFTSSGKLPCKQIIHAAGPIWGEGNEEQKLYDTIQGVLMLADQLGLSSIAIPAISTGIFGFPKDIAAPVIYNSICTYFKDPGGSNISLVRLTLFDQKTIDIFLNRFNTWKNGLNQNAINNI